MFRNKFILRLWVQRIFKSCFKSFEDFDIISIEVIKNNKLINLPIQYSFLCFNNSTNTYYLISNC